MITSFLQSWSLFQHSYLTALFAALLLSILGVAVVARGQVFLAAAVAQAATLGTALSLVLGWVQPAVASVGLGVIAACATGVRGQPRRGVEEMTAWVFLIAASLSVLVVSHQAIGMKQVQALLASTLIGAEVSDWVLFGLLSLAGMLLVLVLRPRLVLLLTDPTMASAVGMRVAWWWLALALALGLSTGLALRATGLLFTFGCLALPALIARNLCRRAGTMFLVAPAVAAAAVVAGLVLAHRFDFPPGQVVVALLGAGLLLAWAGASMRERLHS